MVGKMEKKLLFIMNPAAGQRKANRLVPEICLEFQKAGYRTELFITQARGDATKIASGRGAEFDRVVCAGGDGTLNETISGILAAGAKPVVGYIPAGTTNDYANSLGLSTDVLQAARDAVTGQETGLDIGSFNGRSFIYTASCGAFTKASYSTNQDMKNMLGHLAYVFAGIMDLGSLKPYHLRVEANGNVYEDDFVFCGITNSTSLGGILKLDDRLVTLNDGMFEVMLIRHPQNPAQLSGILHALTFMELPSEQIHFFSSEEIHVDCSADIEWTLDGERQDGSEHIVMKNLPRAAVLSLPGAQVDHRLLSSEP